jgi:hypothetical protein
MLFIIFFPQFHSRKHSKFNVALKNKINWGTQNIWLNRKISCHNQFFDFVSNRVYMREYKVNIGCEHRFFYWAKCWSRNDIFPCSKWFGFSVCSFCCCQVLMKLWQNLCAVLCFICKQNVHLAIHKLQAFASTHIHTHSANPLCLEPVRWWLVISSSPPDAEET